MAPTIRTRPRRRLLAAATLAAGTITAPFLLAGSASAAIGYADPGAFYCEGLPATIIGTNGADVIWGTAGNDVIVSLGGDDTVYGSLGHDKICLGAGNDVGIGNDGDDVIRGGSGTDQLRGMAGIDLLMGDDGDDALIGGTQTDYLYGGNGADWLTGDAGADFLVGGSGNDTLDAAWLDDDTVDHAAGGLGDDVIFTDDASPVADDARGEGGTDDCYVDAVDTVLTCEGP